MLQLITASIAFMILILDSKSAIQSALEGIQFCIQTVVPSIFPMMVLSLIITGNSSGKSHPFLQKICHPFCIPKGYESILLIGLIGGYPVGARCIEEAHASKEIPAQAAKRMMGFCSNAGPSFIFGIGSSVFSSVADLWALWIIHMLSALVTGLLLPNKSHSRGRHRNEKPYQLTDAMVGAVKSTGLVCGWILLFRVFLGICERWFLWLLPRGITGTLYGFTELANGFLALRDIPDEGARFMLCSAMLAFGGVSVLLQTKSVSLKTGLGLYIPGKLMQTAFSIIFASVWLMIRYHSIVYLPFLIGLLAIGIIYFVIFPNNLKFTVDFPSRFVYNGTKSNRKG